MFESLPQLSEHIDEIAKICSGLAVIFGVWWTVAKWIVPLYKHIYNSFRQLDIIISEFHPNGGSSLKDALNRLEVNVSAVRTDAMRMEARQWAMVSSLKDPIFETDEDGQCIRANPAYLALVERPLADIQGNGWENVIHPEDRAMVWREWEDAITRRRTFESSYKVRSMSGIIYNVNCVAIPYYSFEDMDNPIGYIGRFVSVRKQPCVKES